MLRFILVCAVQVCAQAAQAQEGQLPWALLGTRRAEAFQVPRALPSVALRPVAAPRASRSALPNLYLRESPREPRWRSLMKAVQGLNQPRDLQDLDGEEAQTAFPNEEDATSARDAGANTPTRLARRGLPIARVRGTSSLADASTMIEITAEGQVSEYTSTLTSIRWMLGRNKLASRDARLLRSNAPVLAARQGFIIFNLGELRGILQPDRITLMPARSQDESAAALLAEEIKRRLEDGEDGQPFEVLALESILEQVYAVIEETLQRLSMLVTSTLRELANGRGSRFDDLENRREAALGRLLPLRISLSSLQARSRRLTVLLDEVLDSEEDISDMCLTLRQNELSAIASGSSAELDSDALDAKMQEQREAEEAAQDVVETLLDVYDARLTSLVDQIEQLVSEIANTQDAMELTLSNERNRIARLELLTSIAGLAAGISAAVSGFFGMNLVSGLETASGVFLTVTGLTILLAGSLMLTLWRQFRSISRRQRDRLMDVDALKNVLAILERIALALRGRPPLPRLPKAMRAELSALISSSGIAMLSNRELSMLCSLLTQQSESNGQGLDLVAD